MSFIQDLKQQYKYGGIVQKLIFWSVGISVFLFILKGVFSTFYSMIIPYIGLSGNWFSALIKPWTILTYAVAHAGVWHLIFNMLILYFIGNLFLTFFNQKQFLTAYILGAVGGGVFYILASLFWQMGILVGASAAIMSPLIGLAFYAPHMEVRLALIGRVKMWHIAIFIVILDIFQLSSSNFGGHLAHLGGALSGVLYIRLLTKGTDLSCVFDKLVNLFKHRQGAKFKKVYVNKKADSQTKVTEDKNKQQKIDRILDKISKSGYESLTKEEKDFLFRTGKD
ncbi:rhomboid family protein [Myroides indicus]|uniref:Membrane associated rhomboid family serine protease n=1 Tax=Myroides indicus TaxID=1323422 RepID=A0A4R7EWF8_9FLAO|nr:rhomboid family intramembrane serine protease [Myroides indicus]TDS58835.1 membrane associated rhomboid family serine protease [Myroides indicus]